MKECKFASLLYSDLLREMIQNQISPFDFLSRRLRRRNLSFSYSKNYSILFALCDRSVRIGYWRFEVKSDCSMIILVLLINNITAFWRCRCRSRSRRRFLNSPLLEAKRRKKLRFIAKVCIIMPGCSRFETSRSSYFEIVSPVCDFQCFAKKLRLLSGK